MFLKQVYRHNRVLFIAFVCFMLGQAAINLNHGAVFSPFYLFGMYSEKFNIQDQYQVMLVEVNGAVLKGEDFSIREWDKIYQPVYYFLASDSVNTSMLSIRNRLLHKMRLNNTSSRYLLNEQFRANDFMNWYRLYLQKITNVEISSLQILQQAHRFESGRLSALLPVRPIPNLPPWNSATATVNK